jgi:hypothetical protein
MLPLAVVVVCTALAGGFTLVASRVVTRAGRAEADASARQRFVAAFDARDTGAAGIPAALVVQTFETLAARVGDQISPASLRPDARLEADLGLGAADVEDVALLVAAHCNGRIPRERDLDALHREVETVGELIDYLAPFVAGPAVHVA